MRVLYALPYVPSLIRVRPYNLIRQLAKRHEVVVLAMGSSHDRADAIDLRRYCARVEVVPFRLAESIASCAKAALDGEPLQSAVCRSDALVERFQTLLSGDRFDLVHVEHLRAAYLGALVPAGTPSVFDSVDCISLLLQRTLRSSHSLKQKVIAALELGRTRRYETRELEIFDRVVVTSPDDADALGALSAGAPVAVVPNGVDLDYFRPTLGEKSSATLVFSGKMSYHANVTALMHFVRYVYPLIRLRRPDVRLVVVGSNPPPAVRALERDPSITVTGYVADLRQELGRATVAVCPVTVKVGIQNKVLEAMACGVPVVSSPAGITGLGVTPGREVLVGATPLDLAEGILELLSDPLLRRRIAEAGREYVEAHHRWDVVAAGLEEVYRSALRLQAATRAA